MISVERITDDCFVVFDVGEAVVLQQRHRIVGTMAGPMGKFKGGNEAFSGKMFKRGMPLVLMPEEARLLVEEGIGSLVQTVYDTEEEHFDDFFSGQFKDRVVDEPRDSSSVQIPHIYDAVPEASRVKQGISYLNSTRNLPQAARSLVYSPQMQCKGRSEEVSFPPLDADSRLRYLVFSDLWRRGFHITSGINFGGDFMAYMGEPWKFHSSFTVFISDADTLIRPNELVIAGRLGTVVHKALLIATLIDQKLVYSSLQWNAALSAATPA